MDDKKSSTTISLEKLAPRVRIRERLLTRLLVSHILIASVPIFVTGKLLIDTARGSIEETILERNLQFARRSSRLIEAQLDKARKLIKSTAQFPSIYHMDSPSQKLAILTLVDEFPVFKEIIIFDTTFTAVVSTSPVLETRLKIGRKLKQSGLPSREETTYEVYGSDEQLLMVDIPEPIINVGEVVGTLYAIVDLQTMWDIVDENVVGVSGEAFIFEKEGDYIAHSDRVNVYSEETFQNSAVIDSIRAGRSGHMRYVTDGNIEMVAAYAPVGDFGWGFMIQQPVSEAFASADRMGVRVIQLMIVSVLFASLIAYFYTRLIVSPVKHLVSGMEQFSHGDLAYRIQKLGNDEIGTLAENFNEMADRLMEYQSSLKRTQVLETLGKLASVLSHEIRNPLNSMVINMQILRRELSKERIQKERVDKFYSIIDSEIKRVDQLVKDFLLIARPPKLERAKVSIHEILDEVLMTQVADSLTKGIRVERDYHEGLVEVNADLDKMRQVLLNLIINAIQAMPGGGRLKISTTKNISPHRTRNSLKSNSISISFEDSGSGIKQEDLNKIFDFYYSTKRGGSGLGLAIVQQIVDQHKGKIVVKSKVNAGTTFTVFLPLY